MLHDLRGNSFSFYIRKWNIGCSFARYFDRRYVLLPLHSLKSLYSTTNISPTEFSNAPDICNVSEPDVPLSEGLFLGFKMIVLLVKTYQDTKTILLKLI